MNKVSTSTLDDMCELIVDCPHFTPEWTKSGFIVIRNQNIRDGRLDLTDPSYTHREDFERRIRRAKPRASDIVFTREAPMGEVCMVPDNLECCIGQRQVSFAPQEKCSWQVSVFCLRSTVRHQIFWNEGTGSTVSNVRIPVLEALKIPRMGDSENEIGDLLGALDDKIDLNRQMNEALEAMARLFFKDWFVDFGPTRAKAEGRQPYLSPELWSLFPDALDDDDKPMGWIERRVEDVLELAYGKALKASDRRTGLIPVYGSGGITGYHNEHLVDGPSMIVGRKGTVGSLYWEDSHFFPIDTVFYVKPKAPLTFCYYLLKTLGLEEMNTDAAVPGLNRNNVYRLPVAWSCEQLREAFDTIVTPLRSQIFSNTEESRTLAKPATCYYPNLCPAKSVSARPRKSWTIGYEPINTNRGLAMLQTFEVIVEPDGAIHPLEELHVETPTRAILTLLETPSPAKAKPAPGNGAAILALLQTPRFANRPSADPKEIEQRIQNLRHDWDGE